MRQGLVFEVADHLLDDGVLAMLGLHCCERFEAVGREREVAPLAGEQLALGGEQAHAANDQPAAAEDALGDLRLTRVGVVVKDLPGGLVDLATIAVTGLVILTPIENCQPALAGRSNTFAFQNPVPR